MPNIAHPSKDLEFQGVTLWQSVRGLQKVYQSGYDAKITFWVCHIMVHIHARLFPLFKELSSFLPVPSNESTSKLSLEKY